MSSFSNMDKRTKRLLAVLGVVLLVAFYMTVIKGGGDSAPAPEPAKKSQTATTPQEESQPDGLPADPTQDERPGSDEAEQGVQTPARYPGTGPVVVVYNPFQSAE